MSKYSESKVILGGRTWGGAADPAFRALVAADISSLVPNTVNVIFDGGGSVLTAGMMGEVELPSGFTLTEWRCLLQAAESITITVTRATYAAYATFSALSPALALSTSGAIKNEATGLTTALTSGWILRFEITSAPASATWARAILKMTRV